MNNGSRSYAGMGASGYSSGRYQGFGSSPSDTRSIIPSPSPVYREPIVPVNPYSFTSGHQQAQPNTSKGHVPGKPGGSWDDDDEMFNSDDGVPMKRAMDTNEAIIDAFCSESSKLPTPSELQEVIERLEYIKASQLSAALSNESADYTMRSLLITEWLLHRQPIPHITEQLERVRHSSDRIQLKVHKLKLIADSDNR